MGDEEIYIKLEKDVQYALNSGNLNLAYEAYGAVKMARLLGVITSEQFFELNDRVVKNGIIRLSTNRY